MTTTVFRVGFAGMAMISCLCNPLELDDAPTCMGCQNSQPPPWQVSCRRSSCKGTALLQTSALRTTLHFNGGDEADAAPTVTNSSSLPSPSIALNRIHELRLLTSPVVQRMANLTLSLPGFRYKPATALKHQSGRIIAFVQKSATSRVGMILAMAIFICALTTLAIIALRPSMVEEMRAAVKMEPASSARQQGSASRESITYTEWQQERLSRGKSSQRPNVPDLRIPRRQFSPRQQLKTVEPLGTNSRAFEPSPYGDNRLGSSILGSHTSLASSTSHLASHQIPQRHRLSIPAPPSCGFHVPNAPFRHGSTGHIPDRTFSPPRGSSTALQQHNVPSGTLMYDYPHIVSPRPVSRNSLPSPEVSTVPRQLSPALHQGQIAQQRTASQAGLKGVRGLVHWFDAATPRT